MDLTQLDRVTIKPVGKLCCNCAFCGKAFGLDCCMLIESVSRILCQTSNSVISCIFNTTCGMFAPKREIMEMLKTRGYEEFEMLRTLGKFDGIPEEIVKMRENFFTDKHDSSSKQVEYMRYLAACNQVLPPLVLGDDLDDIVPIEDKSILRVWIGDVVSKQMKAAMI